MESTTLPYPQDVFKLVEHPTKLDGLQLTIRLRLLMTVLKLMHQQTT